MSPELPLNRVLLRLYVSGEASLALTAQDNIERIRDAVGHACEIEVIDVVADPEVAERDRIIITPTLVRVEPPPHLRVAGDLADVDATLDALGIRAWARNHGGGS
jgi:circadian clock protein KaiB